MPANIIQSFAKKSNKSQQEVEKLWDKAQKIAKEKFKDEDEVFYKYATGVLKNMLGITESKITNKLLFNLSVVNEAEKQTKK